jgi:hypothetical protein
LEDIEYDHQDLNSSFIMANQVPRLTINLTVANVKIFVSWSNKNNARIPLGRIMDEHARFILNIKFKSNAVRIGVTDQFFDNWYETWTHPKLAIWVNKIFVEKLSTTVEKEFESFKLGLNTPEMQLMSISKEYERLGKLNDILQR